MTTNPHTTAGLRTQAPADVADVITGPDYSSVFRRVLRHRGKPEATRRDDDGARAVSRLPLQRP